MQLRAQFGSLLSLIENQTVTPALLAATPDSPGKNQRKEWLEAAVKTGNVAIVNMLIQRYPSIVAEHPNGFPCAYAFETHNLPILETLLKAGADISKECHTEKSSGGTLISFGLNLFIHQGATWYSRNWRGQAKNWYRRCMKKLLTLRSTDQKDEAGYNFALECVMKALCETNSAPGLDQLLLRLLQAGANPNAAKDYFYMLVKHPRPDIILMLRRYGADFGQAPKQLLLGSGELNLVDFATHLSGAESTAARKQLFIDCKNAIECGVVTAADMYYRNNQQSWYYSPEHFKGIPDYKEMLLAHMLKLPLEEKIEALEKANKHDNANLLSRIFWFQRGWKKPTEVNGIRVRLANELIRAKLELQLHAIRNQIADVVSESARANLDPTLQAFQRALASTFPLTHADAQPSPRESTSVADAPASPARSTTASLYPMLVDVSNAVPAPAPQPASNPFIGSFHDVIQAPEPTTAALEPVFMHTAVFNANMAALPDVRNFPPPVLAHESPKEEKKVNPVKLHS